MGSSDPEPPYVYAYADHDVCYTGGFGNIVPCL